LPVVTEERGNGAVTVQAVVSLDLAEQLRAQAELERRSISATIRNALEDQLRRRSKPERRG
jgi:hypothetical protein